MMRKLSLIVSMLLVASTWGQVINIPDANFKNVLVNAPCVQFVGDSDYHDADTNNDGEIDFSEATAPIKLAISNNNISQAEGLQYFTNLEVLQFTNNPVTALPISGLVNLTFLYCANNALTSLDISGLVNLTFLDCSHNALTNLNISLLSNLTWLECSSNQIGQIDFHNNHMLNYIECSANDLLMVDICGTVAEYFACAANPNLTYISVKNNIVSDDFFIGRGEPPIPTFWFGNLPSLTSICYDEGEFGAITYNFLDWGDINFSTSCSCDFLSVKKFSSEIGMFPNPAHQSVNFDLGTIKVMEIVIYNSLGQAALILTNPNSLHSLTTDIAGLAPGTYFAKIICDSGIETKKLIKI